MKNLHQRSAGRPSKETGGSRFWKTRPHTQRPRVKAGAERSARVGGSLEQVHEDALEKGSFPATGVAAKFLQQHPALLSTLTASQKADGPLLETRIQKC